jgi:uncharacterized coiled-coil protein SlyX
MEPTLSDLEARLTQCQEQIAELNTKMAMVLKFVDDADRRLHKLERRFGIELMGLARKLEARP